MPELWLWHVPEWRMGVADWVAWDDVGFALAAGTVDRGKEAVAEWLGKQRDVAVSHGMPYTSIKRDPLDSSVIVEHITKEISPLPRWAAANKRTGFVMLGTPEETKSQEDDPMAIPAKKKQELVDRMNLDPNLLDQLEQLNATVAAKAQAEGIKSKEEAVAAESTDVTTVTSTSNTASSANVVVEVAGTGVVEPETEAEEPLSRDEIVEALVPMQKQIADLVSAVGAITETLKELKAADEQKIDKQVANIPSASLAGLLAQRMSAIGDKSAQVRSDSGLAKDTPEEAQAAQGAFGIPFLDKLVTDNGKN
jgi:hypothetical protein